MQLPIKVGVAALAAVLHIGMAEAQDSGWLYGVKMSKKEIVARSLVLGSPQPVKELGKLGKADDERISGVFQNTDRSVGLLGTSTKLKSDKHSLVRVIGIPQLVIDASSDDIDGLASAYALSSIAVPLTGLPLALVASDTPPFWLANVDLNSGRVSILNVPLSPKRSYSHLTHCPNGNVYAVSAAPQWDVRLVQFDLARRLVISLNEFKFNGLALHFTIADLACNPSNQLYALADIDHSGIATVLRVDTANGNLTWVTKFDVNRMVFVR